jgi:hypothetical protein
MANISLKRLFEAQDFKAKSKETGKLVHFKSKDSYQAALKAGSHEEPKKDKKAQAKQAAQSADMFKGDYSKERGAESPKVNLPKKASELTYKHNTAISDTLNKELELDGIADSNPSSMDPDNNTIQYTASAGEEPTYSLYFGPNYDYNKPDEFRVSLESTYGNDPSNLSGKNDKSFKSAEDAMKYLIALGKKYKKELQMDDDDTNESTKLTSMIKK